MGINSINDAECPLDHIRDIIASMPYNSIIDDAALSKKCQNVIPPLQVTPLVSIIWANGLCPPIAARTHNQGEGLMKMFKVISKPLKLFLGYYTSIKFTVQ